MGKNKKYKNKIYLISCLYSIDIMMLSASCVFQRRKAVKYMPLDHCLHQSGIMWAINNHDQRVNERETPGKASGEKHPVPNDTTLSIKGGSYRALFPCLTLLYNNYSGH